jgi:transcriptional regulator with XRE-family HTH domain
MEKRAKRPNPTKGGKAYETVSEMVGDLADGETIRAFERYRDEHRLVSRLILLRGSRDLTQAELARKMGCGQPKVSKMESVVDADLNFGDIVKYATSLGYVVNVSFAPAKSKASSRIGFHLSAIRRELDRLVMLAGEDQAILGGAFGLLLETTGKIVALMKSAANGLAGREELADPVSVQTEEEEIDEAQDVALAPGRRNAGELAKA